MQIHPSSLLAHALQKRFCRRLRDVVNGVAKGYEIRWDLLGREALAESDWRSDSEGKVAPSFERQPRSAIWEGNNVVFKSDFDRHELKRLLDAFKEAVRANKKSAQNAHSLDTYLR